MDIPSRNPMAIRRSKPILKELWSNKEFFSLETPLTEIEELWTVFDTFLRVYRCFYAPRGADVVPKHHLHFTQFSRHDNVKQDIGPSEGFHNTIRFDIGFKNMSKDDAWSVCLDRMHKMNILFDTNYSSPSNIGLEEITKNWMGNFHLLKYEVALLIGERTFMMELWRGKVGH